jgi:cytoskeleton protein RodZ
MATGTFGERLKREREMREVSLKEVTSATRIGPRFLEALENEEWDKLPGGIFNRGFVRSIARCDQSMPAPQPYENKLPRPPIWLPILAVLAILAILGGLVAGGVYGWRRYAAHRAAKQPSSSALSPEQTQTGTLSVVPSAAAASSSDSATSSSAIPLDLAVSTSAATRVRILADGTVLLDAEIPAGETHHFSATQQFEVTVADSSAVLLELNGRAMPPVGTPGASGTIMLSQKDLRQASGGTPQP